MNRFVRGLRICQMFAAALVASGEVYAQQIDIPTPMVEQGISGQYAEQVAVLQDGGVLAGRIDRDGDRYVIERGAGKIVVPANRVMLVASSLDDAYQQRRQRITAPTADSHVALADWCLRQNLLERADQELVSARALDARHERIPILEQWLALIRDRPQSAVKKAVEDRQVKPADAKVFTSQQVASIGELPAGVVQLFTRKVQPVLVNNCATSGCHALGDQSTFQLDRSILHGMSNRRSTMNNLSATLALVDRERPELSPVLTISRQVHGGMNAPVFGPRQVAAFQHVYDWVMQVTQHTGRATQEAQQVTNQPDGVSGNLRHAHLTAPVMRMSKEALGTTTDGPNAVGADNFTYETTIEFQPQANSSKNSPVSVHPSWEPRDEFDPEVFNRKYSPQAVITPAPPPPTKAATGDRGDALNAPE